MPHFGAGYFREALMLADLCPNVYLDTSSSNSWMRYEGLDLPTVFRRGAGGAGAQPPAVRHRTPRFSRAAGTARSSKRRLARWLELGIGSADARQILGGNLRRILTEF